MADFQYTRTHLNFTGAETKTITVDANHAAKIQYLEIFVAAARVCEVKVGSTVVAKGTIAAEASPAVLRYGKGQGSGVFGDNITVQMDGACEVFIGYESIAKT